MPGYRDLAACTDSDPELFYPVSTPGSDQHVKDSAVARRICSRCPVRRECLNEALGAKPGYDFGIWGGTDPVQRVQLRKRADRPTGRQLATA